MILELADAQALMPDLAADARLPRWLAQADAALRRWLDRKVIELAEVSERADGSGHNRIWLREYPVSAVSSVTVDGQAQASGSWDFIPGQEVPTELRRGSPPAPLDHLCGPSWPTGYGNVGIAYTAGYDPVPPDLQAAIVELVRYFQGSAPSGQVGPGDKRVKHRDYEVERFSPADVLAGRRIPPLAEGFAEFYRRKGI